LSEKLLSFLPRQYVLQQFQVIQRDNRGQIRAAAAYNDGLALGGNAAEYFRVLRSSLRFVYMVGG
jgi:hypothetical protein